MNGASVTSLSATCLTRKTLASQRDEVTGHPRSTCPEPLSSRNDIGQMARTESG